MTKLENDPEGRGRTSPAVTERARASGIVKEPGVEVGKIEDASRRGAGTRTIYNNRFPLIGMKFEGK